MGKSTGETSWTLPSANGDAKPAAGSSPLPKGWEQVTDPATGKPYYRDHNTGKTSWTPPDAGAAAPAGGERQPGLRAVEVGVYQGESSYRWLQDIEDLSVLLVDPYQEVFDSGDSYRELLNTTPADDLVLLHRRMQPYIQTGQASVMVAPSASAAECVPNRSIDLVYLDGDHSKEAVARDIRAWLPKVQVGGVIAGHDYQPFFAWGADEEASSRETSPRTSSLAEVPSQSAMKAHGVAAAVHEALPQGQTLHLAPNGVWWWMVLDGATPEPR